MRKYRWAIFAAALAGCGGQTGQTTSAVTAAGCAPFACVTAPDGTRSANVDASPDQTDSLTAHCAGAATCGDVTAAAPVCVEYTSGGKLLSLFACPAACCQ